MSLAKGHRLGPYEIIRLLGAGGMGAVYEARDTRLGRTVAVKILPERWARKPQLRARLEREARVVSRLKHPHICTLHDVGEARAADCPVFYIVMEKVEGETLSDRLARGRLPISEVIGFGRQIAGALAAAHRQGVLHRDLKPGNIMITPHGIKLLDFGLAKTLGEPPPGVAATQAENQATASLPFPLTEERSIPGTVPYMSPEQLEGREVDQRTDIFALGAVLHEMATGRRAFPGESRAGVIAAILHEEPGRISRLLPGTPPGLDRIVARCLDKSPDLRWRDAADIGIALQDLAAIPADARPASRKRRTGRTAALMAAALVVGLLVGAALWRLGPGPSPSPEPAPVSFSFGLPTDIQIEDTSLAGVAVAVAPDGSFLVFSATNADGDRRIYRRSLSSVGVRPVAGTEGGRQPFVSSDSTWIGFITESGGLAKVPAAGGLPQKIFDGERLLPAEVCWGEDDRIYFPRGLTGGIGAVSASGGGFESLTNPDQKAGEIGHWHPQLLPGGRRLLFQVWTAEGFRTRILDLDDKRITNVAARGAQLRYVQPGYLLWREQDKLVAAPFDPVSGQVGGEPRALLSGLSGYDISGQGTLVTFRAASSLSGDVVRLSWPGGEAREHAGVGRASQVRVSPGGRWLALSTADNIWLADPQRGVRSRLTTDGVINNFPVWTPDGHDILFNSARRPHGIWMRSTDGLDEPQLILKRETSTVYLPGSVSPDGRTLALTELFPDLQADIAMLELDSGKVLPLVSTPAREGSPAFSPDGRWLAYVADESGRDEVYVRPHPEPGRRIQISTEGGTDPRWTRGGEGLLFRREEALYEVAMGPSGDPAPGQPTQRGRLLSLIKPVVPFSPTWDMAPDGDILYLRAPGEVTEPTEITVRVGWSPSVEPPLR